MTAAFPFLLQPIFWSARNRARRRERGDGLRAALFGGIALAVAAALFAIAFWLTWQLLDYEELGDYLIRLGLGWLFLTFLSFVGFSALVSALTTFFLSEDLRLLLPAGAQDGKRDCRFEVRRDDARDHGTAVLARGPKRWTPGWPMRTNQIWASG